MSLPFDFEIPVTFFEKADAEKGKQRRIGGIISTEDKDRQQEVILQRGLDFNDFLSNGWFNDNHSKKTTDILGYPEKVASFKKGQKLPDGSVAQANGTWTEGYLLDTEEARKVWNLGKALQKTNRRLGFSVEGAITKRTGKKKNVIAKAKVRNVAITNCPVNSSSRLELLTKSLQAVEDSDDTMDKALAVGPCTPGEGPTGGVGAGQVLVPESLEQDEKTGQYKLDFDGKKKKKVKKSLTDSEAKEWFRSRLPNASDAQLGRMVTITRHLKALGKL